MELEESAPDARLGNCLEIFKPMPANIIAGFIIGILLIGGSLALFTFLLREVHLAGGNLPLYAKKGMCWLVVGLGSVIGIVLMVGGVVVTIYSKGLIASRVEVYVNGLRQCSRRSNEQILWCDVEKVRETILYERPPLLKGPLKLLLPKCSSASYTLVTPTKEYSFDGNSIKAIKRFGDLLRERAQLTSLPWETVEEGQFGVIRVHEAEFLQSGAPTNELTQILSERDEAAFEQGFFDGSFPHFFAVDLDADLGAIVDDCAGCLDLTSLDVEWREEDVFLAFNGREVLVPLQSDQGDAHLMVCALNELLNPEFEVRYIVISHGCDSPGFAALPGADWQALEEELPLAVAENFIDPRLLPNVVTKLTYDMLPEAARARLDRMKQRTFESTDPASGTAC
jgi:hypothetical protein